MTKTKKRVYYCDVRAVSHSCDVLFIALKCNNLINVQWNGFHSKFKIIFLFSSRCWSLCGGKEASLRLEWSRWALYRIWFHFSHFCLLSYSACPLVTNPAHRRYLHHVCIHHTMNSVALALRRRHEAKSYISPEGPLWSWS